MPGESLAALYGRIGAHRLHTTHDSRELTRNARAAFHDSFLEKVDPALPTAERLRRAEHLRKAHYAELAARSAKARRAKSRKAKTSEAG